eukprot:4611755-Pleurochrysis_carterae.AAC.2
MRRPLQKRAKTVARKSAVNVKSQAVRVQLRERVTARGVAADGDVRRRLGVVNRLRREAALVQVSWRRG